MENESKSVSSFVREFVSVPEQIFRVAEFTPDRIAVSRQGIRLTFGELASRACGLSVKLASMLGEERGTIAVVTDDSLHMIIAALAAWKTGCAYLPLDPSAPIQRTEYMLEESGARVIIAEAGLDFPARGADKQLHFGDLQDVSSGSLSAANAAWNIQPEDAAYVIYTSGSTGRPKGVLVTHSNLAYLASWYRATFQVEERDIGSQFAALTFDASILETWPILAAGASLYLVDRSLALSPSRLRDCLVENKISISFAATPLAEQLMSLDWPTKTSLRYLLTGADTLRRYPEAQLPFQLINNYGPTECTVLATSGPVPIKNLQTVPPSIGRPLPETEIFLLGPDLLPVPDGECGQIAITGPGVAAGYVHRPDLTQERFLDDSFVAPRRLYLTGDIGRKLPNGEIEFRGRLDDQLKLRGYRIEPSEVIAALRSHPAVSHAAVKAIRINEEKHLAAYVVLRDEVSASELRSHLGVRLPSYMIPSYIVRLTALPVTPQGKVDFAALPEPDSHNSLDEAESIAELHSEIESQVTKILSNLLGGRTIRSQENFFRIGGHSLLAAQVLSRIRSSFSIELPLREIFESPTVESLSSRIQQRILDSLSSTSASDPLEHVSL